MASSSAMEIDWDKWDAEGRDIARRMREIADRNAREVAESRAARARYEERRAREEVAHETPPSFNDRSLHERLDRFDAALARIEGDLSAVKPQLAAVVRDVADIRERMATRVELESFKHDVSTVADGFAQTQARLAGVTDLLRFLTKA